MASSKESKEREANAQNWNSWLAGINSICWLYLCCVLATSGLRWGSGMPAIAITMPMPEPNGYQTGINTKPQARTRIVMVMMAKTGILVN